MSSLRAARRSLPSILFVLLTAVGSAGWWLAVSRDIAAAQRHEQALIDQTALRIHDWVDERMNLLAIVERLKLDGRLDAERWSWLDGTVEGTPGIQAINWIDERGVIAAIAPVAGNGPALGRSIYEHSAAAPYLRTAFGTGQARASSPLDLFQGGRGFTVYHPVSQGGVVLGAVNAAFRVDAIEALCLVDLAKSHVLALRDGDLDLVRMGTGLSGGPITSASIAVLDRTWILEATPRDPGPSVTRSLPALLAQLLGFLVVALLVHAVLRRQEDAESALRSRQVLATRLQESERLEALARLAGAVAHDVNNVLTVIRAHVDLLADSAVHGVSEAEAALHTQAVDEAAERGAALTSQLLAFARKQPVTRGTVDLPRHVADQARMLQSLAGDGVTVKLSLPPEPLAVDFSADAVNRVLVNLVVNARDAFDGGQGTITIEVAPEGDLALLSVEDDGRGMSDEVLEHVFEPFFSTREEGTGLGLATVHGLSNQAGGTVHLTSAVGQGTRVEVRLPRTTEVPEVAPPPVLVTPPVAATRLRVIVVEDDPLVRRAMVVSVAARGYDVQPFGDAEEALQHAPRADVLVTDLVLPGQTGATLARKLRERWPELAVVIVSGYAREPGDADKIVADGGRFLAKPFSSGELGRVLGEIAGEIEARRGESTEDSG